MSEHFSKHLSNIKTPKVEAPFHQRKLKNAVRAVYFNKGKVSQGSSLLDDLKNMSLKKLIPATVLAVFVFTLAGQSFLTWRNTAYAQELIEETIQKIEAEPLTDEEEKMMTTIEILEALKNAGELKYLGEESYPPITEYGPERIMQKFEFSDSDISKNLIVGLLDYEVYVMVDHSFGPDLFEEIEVKINENNDVVNLDELKLKLKDPNLKNTYLTELIRRGNVREIVSQLNQIKSASYLDDIQKYIEDLSLSESEKLRLLENHKQCNLREEKVLNQLLPLLKESQVLANFGTPSCGIFDEKDANQYKEFEFFGSVFSVAGQNTNLSESRKDINEYIAKLSKFDTPTAKTKADLLKRAADADVTSYPDENGNALLSFPYSGSKDPHKELTITINPQDQTENFVSFSFPQFVSLESDAKELSIEIKTKGGKISNYKEIEEKLNDPQLKDELLLSIIRDQNNRLIEDIETNLSHRNPIYESWTSTMADQLTGLIENSDLLILDANAIPMSKTNSSVFYSMVAYPFGQSEVAADEKLDEVIENLKNSITSENQSNIEILKNALKTNELRYEGEEKWDTKTVQKISFRDPDISRRINLYIDSSDGTVQFVVDSILSDDPYNRFQLDVDEKGNILNLEALKKRLNDPHLKKPWIKDLVRKTNLEWIKTMDEMSERNAWNETYRLQEKNIYIQLEELNKEATVIIGGLGASYHGVIPSYTIDLYSITE